MSRPLCRYCGGPIPKRTHTHYFGRDRNNSTSYSTDHPEKPLSKADAQRLVNQEIVSVRWYIRHEYFPNSYDTIPHREHIDRITTWDGESYEDPFFCSGAHAQKLGYASARAGYAMPEYTRKAKVSTA